MKKRMFIKDIRASHRECWVINAILEGNLLRFERPVGYGCGTYGWNWDCYSIDGLAIFIGDRYPSSVKKVDYETCKKYEEKAKETLEDFEKERQENWELKVVEDLEIREKYKEIMRELLKSMIKEAREA